MKNTKKIIIFSIILIFVLFLIGLTYRVLADENRLTTKEKEWVTQNTSTFHNLSVINNIDVVGKNGQGIIYDFINDFGAEYNLTINPVTYNLGEKTESRAIRVKTKPQESDLIFYQEHYVLLSKKSEYISNLADIKNLNVGTISSDTEYLKSYLTDFNLKPYDNDQLLLEAFELGVDIQYVMVPLETYLGIILSSDYEIIYHLSDIMRYYVFEPVADDTLSSIIKKYYATWQSEKLNIAINASLLKVFSEALNITNKDLDEMTARIPNYGFVNNSPYEVISGGNYGGIVSEYLNRFTAFSGVEFKCVKYRNYNVFNAAVDQGKIDLYFDYYDFLNSYNDIKSLMKISYKIISPSSSDTVINSERSLVNKEIYVLENSLLEKHFKSLGGVKVKTYSSNKELFKLTKKNYLIAIDSQIYNYYVNDELKGYNDRFEGEINQNYQFKFKKSNNMTKLFSKYITTIDPQEVLYAGLYNHSTTIAKGSFQTIIARYILILLGISGILIFVFFKSSKKIKIAKKIKKEDKIKYIDHLTSLKNRNYLSENVLNWNKNTIYPQTAIIVDLNCVQDINDSFGYEEGDKQIKAAANTLIKTQLDNSDIIRTDGNEFLIYLVGYSEKQIISYTRKLYKEFKSLPYDFGAAIGYSMITDDIKTLEDAINEAVENMKDKKEEFEEEKNEKD